MSSPVFLSTSASFPSQVAAFLLQGRKGRPVDLGDSMVIVPTAGAARAVRRELARQAGGVLAPVFKLPMQALLGDADNMATPLERAAAWLRVLQETRREKFAALVPATVKLSQPEDWLGVSSRLLSVCDALAEAGLHPGSAELPTHAPHDAQRWKEFSALYAAYLKTLRQAGREDANAVRLRLAQNGTAPAGIDRIIVALVPDLPVLVSQWLEKISAAGLPVDVVGWSCGEDTACFDHWGRPDPEWWLTHNLNVPDTIIAAENDSALEAEALVDFVAARGNEAFSLVSADADSTAALEAEISKRGTVAYLPEGRPLTRTEAATILSGWMEFSRGHHLSAIRPLLQLPAFLHFFASKTGFAPEDAAAACDILIASKLCRTLDSAKEWSAGNKSTRGEDDVPKKFIAALEKLLEEKISGRDVLGSIYGTKEEMDERTVEELETLVEAIDESSPLLHDLSPEWREALLRTSVAQGRVFDPAPEGAVEINGWLEAPWTDAPVLCVAGCREGALPAGATEDAFLPDKLRTKIGLTDNNSRYARDAYLLSCLLQRHGPSNLRLGYSRFRSGGEPNRPSRLLLGCPDEDLPARVENVFQPSPARRRMHAPFPDWKLRLDPPARVDSIRVTGFKHYLECPLRFYLGQVRGLQPFDPEAREIGAADYGTLLHRVVENLHKCGPADSTEDKVIADFLSKELDRIAAQRFGRNPPPVVLVQIESMRQRLRSLAVLQAAQRRAGWTIVESEYAVKKDAGLTIGPLALVGTMDRVEVHEEEGLRILDYKTFAGAKTPEETHFGRARADDDFPDSAITRTNKAGRPAEKAWIDLQLPLYRHIAAKIWPEYARKTMGVGYILLPGDPDDTQIALLSLDEAAQESAVRCAAAVADRVARGVFWPPAADPDYDDFSAWFGGEHPAEIFDAATIELLEGRP